MKNFDKLYYINIIYLERKHNDRKDMFWPTSYDRYRFIYILIKFGKHVHCNILT